MLQIDNARLATEDFRIKSVALFLLRCFTVSELNWCNKMFVKPVYTWLTQSCESQHGTGRTSSDESSCPLFVFLYFWWLRVVTYHPLHTHTHTFPQVWERISCAHVSGGGHRWTAQGAGRAHQRPVRPGDAGGGSEGGAGLSEEEPRWGRSSGTVQARS